MTMLILLNPHAAGGTALKKWNRIASSIMMAGSIPSIQMMDGCDNTRKILIDAFDRGEKRFVAAGGDGTLNVLLNHLLAFAPPERWSDITLGAIGLGSSNDFHKPFLHPEDDIPVRINFTDASLRDVGCLITNPGLPFQHRYFLSNASIGAVAEANRRFNEPGAFLRLLKRTSTHTAIQCAAVATLFAHRSYCVEIHDPIKGYKQVSMTNLSIVKNVHFAGALHYAGTSEYDNGLFRIILCRDMSRSGLAALIRAFENGRAEESPSVESWRTDAISISSDVPFAVEFDGEVTATPFVQFSILPNSIRVCRS